MLNKGKETNYSEKTRKNALKQKVPGMCREALDDWKIEKGLFFVVGHAVRERDFFHSADIDLGD